MMEELKPCPFCGGEATLCDDGKEWFYIVCGDCGVVTDHVSAREIAVRIWNTRPAEDAKDKEIERLKARLRDIAYLRDLNPDLKHHGNASCAEDGFMDFYCQMGDIARIALGTGPDVPANAPDTGKGEEKLK